MRKALIKLAFWSLLAASLAGCGYNTPIGGISPNIVVVTPTVTVAPPTTAPITTVGPATASVATTAVTSTTTPPKTTLPPLALNPDGTYTVKSGDTLSGIASRLKVDLADLINLNNLKDPDNLQIGQILKVPPRNQ